MSNHRAVWTNVNLATLTALAGNGEIPDGAIAVSEGRIAWLGPRLELPPEWRSVTEVHDCAGAWLTPGLIDCHTHLVHAGNRSAEFEQRLEGASYEQIAKAGGGILSTVKATRAATPAELQAASLPRLQKLMAEGLTTIEIKSGYGLTTEDECKMLGVATRLAHPAALRVQRTFLGAHALPPEFAGRPDDYIALICEEMLPRIAREKLADAVDAFCENIAFSPRQVERVFVAAERLGFKLKLHADQLSDLGGAALAAEHGALSADHLEYSSERSVKAMAQHGTVAVLLPGAFYTLRERQLPPVAQLRKHAVPMAVSTDCNPGTSPCTSLLQMMNMACTLFGLTAAEALAGVTVHAARALGLHTKTGKLAVGLAADFALWQIERPAELAYAIGSNPCIGRVFAGRSLK